MRTLAVTSIAGVALLLAGCGRSDDADRRYETHPKVDAAERQSGRLAHGLAKEAGKAAAAAARDLGHAASEAHQGWKEASQDDKARRERR